MSTGRTETSSSTRGSRNSITDCFLIISQKGQVIFRKSVRLQQLQMTLESHTREKLGTWKLVTLQFGQKKLVGWEGSQKNTLVPQNGAKLTLLCGLKREEHSGSAKRQSSITDRQKQGSTTHVSKHGIGGITSLCFNANGLSRQ